MNIVVLVKQVPDTETRAKVAADGRSLDPAGVTWVLNPYDEYAIEQALRDHIPQIVMLGAGYDTRAHRFAAVNGATTIFELDQPQVLAYKSYVLSQRGIRAGAERRRARRQRGPGPRQDTR